MAKQSPEAWHSTHLDESAFDVSSPTQPEAGPLTKRVNNPLFFADCFPGVATVEVARTDDSNLPIPDLT